MNDLQTQQTNKQTNNNIAHRSSRLSSQSSIFHFFAVNAGMEESGSIDNQSMAAKVLHKHMGTR